MSNEYIHLPNKCLSPLDHNYNYALYSVNCSTPLLHVVTTALHPQGGSFMLSDMLESFKVNILGESWRNIDFNISIQGQRA